MPVAVAVADADSYLKWSAATLEALPPEWTTELWLLQTPIAPSVTQREAATSRSLRVGSLPTLLRRLRAQPPDVLLLGCTGPVTQVLLSRPARWWLGGSRRPVLVTGLPGISVPASERAVRLRDGVDLMVVHSRREQREFTELVRRVGGSAEVGLARLPFLTGTAARGGDDVVFAAQAKVPAGADGRRRILAALAGLPAPYRAVVKLRGTGAERQTHDEADPYPELWDGAADIRFVAGPMATALETAAGLVTVSSTAALEAIDRGVPLLVLTDFGVSAETINEVFEGSGCFGTLADLAAGRFTNADPGWRDDNYFHPAADSDWIDRLQALLTRRDDQALPAVRHRPIARWPRRSWWLLRTLWPWRSASAEHRLVTFRRLR